MTTTSVFAATLVALLPKGVPEFMRGPLWVHVAAGLVGIVSGYLALYATKGTTLHRKSGIVFVYAMVTMGLLASVVAVSEANVGSVIGGLFTAYLVVTALTTVRPPTEGSRRLDRALMILALTLGFAQIVLTIAAYVVGNERSDGVPAAVPLIFTVITLLAVAGDLRVMRAGGIHGPQRLARHLWRMCFALFTATGSFFLGQARVIPKPVRIFPLLIALAVAPLVAMAYWAWRVQVRRKLRGIVVAVTPEASAA